MQTADQIDESLVALLEKPQSTEMQTGPQFFVFVYTSTMIVDSRLVLVLSLVIVLGFDQLVKYSH